MASDEECDYMSDNFLAQCVQTDIRPGLIHDRNQQRCHNMMKTKVRTDEENKERFRPQRVVEAERREEGLSVALNNENRGFALLQKMGYKPGSGIGKLGAGRVEPVPITLKSGRQGLGRETALKQIAIEKAAIRSRIIQQREQLTNTETYRAHMTRKSAARQVEADLRKSQRVCETLDTSKGFDAPAEVWFWPERCKGNQDEDQESDEDEGKDSDEDKDKESEDKDKESEDKDKESEDKDKESEDEIPEEEIEFELPEKLEILTSYLRKTYFYCVWCGTQHDDEKDMKDSCPGPTHDDH